MENNKFTAVVVVALLVISCFTIGFVVGQHHEREYGDHFNLRINDQEISIEKKEEGRRRRIVAPFVDIEYNDSK